MTSTKPILNCWIANVESEAFPVETTNKLFVSHLRAAIHNAVPGKLSNVDVRQLKLWKVSIKLTQDFETEWGKLQSCIQLDPLCETDLLSDIFSDPAPGYLHVIAQVYAPPFAKRPRSPAPEEAETSKKMRTVAHERKWSIDGAISGPMTSQFYFLDPAGQKQNKSILDAVESREFLLIAGSRTSGKTTRLFRLRELLEETNYRCFYFTFQRVDDSKHTDTFWSSIGEALQYANRSPFSISSSETFIDAFATANWDRPVVLLIDDLSEISLASEDIRNSFLGTLHRIQHSQSESAITSVIAAGTFSAIRMTTTNASPSAFRFSTVVQSPCFSLEETRQLFDLFARDNNIHIDSAVVDEIWDMSNGHPGAVGVCGRLVSDNLKSLRESKTIPYGTWQIFSMIKMHQQIVAHDPFRSMIKALCDVKARSAVQLYRVLFSGFLEEVEVEEGEENLADVLVSEGALSRPDLSVRKYLATSPLTDGVIRNQVLSRVRIEHP